MNTLMKPGIKVVLYNSKFTKCATEKIISLMDTYLHEVFEKAFKKVLYPPVSVDKILRAAVSKRRCDLIVSVSRIDPFKRVEDAVMIFKFIRDYFNYDAELCIAGHLENSRRCRTYYKSLLELVKKLNLEKQIHFRINISTDEMIDILTTAKVFLHTARYEHFGIAVVEGMAAGLVPVVHNSGGVREIVPRDNLFDNLYDAAYKIIKILETWNPKMAKLYQRKSLEFNENIFVRKFAKIIESVC